MIAIENVRLFQELKESLEQQTATSEILGVIASSPTDIQPVLNAIAENSARLCERKRCLIVRIDGDSLKRVANYGPLQASLGTGPLIDRDSVPGRAIIDRQTLHIADLHRRNRRTSFRRALPDGLVFELTCYAIDAREDTHWSDHDPPNRGPPFSDKQIKLLETFASRRLSPSKTYACSRNCRSATGSSRIS